jgi:GNAT superfamily N-acetyltransferase
MVPLRLRRYRPDDRAACLSLFEGNIPDSFFPSEIPQFLEFLDWLPGPYLVMESENRLVACGGLAEHPAYATLCWGMVARDHQRQGIGRFLLQARLALAACMPSVRQVHMNTSQRTAPFFAKEGFRTLRVTRNGYAPGLDRHDMELRLGTAVREKIKGYLTAWQATGRGMDLLKPL